VQVQAEAIRLCSQPHVVMEAQTVRKTHAYLIRWLKSSRVALGRAHDRHATRELAMQSKRLTTLSTGLRTTVLTAAWLRDAATCFEARR